MNNRKPQIYTLNQVNINEIPLKAGVYIVSDATFYIQDKQVSQTENLNSTAQKLLNEAKPNQVLNFHFFEEDDFENRKNAVTILEDFIIIPPTSAP